MKTSAFTLLEMLMVIVVLGILLGVGVPSYLRYTQRLTMQQGTQQFARDVDRTRNEAKRSNTCRAITYVSATSYRVLSYTTPNCTGTPTEQVITMLNGTTLTAVSTTTLMEFRPPYGTNLGTPISFRIANRANTTIAASVHLTGVMGKVIIK